jgi:hypothetical protein
MGIGDRFLPLLEGKAFDLFDGIGRRQRIQTHALWIVADENTGILLALLIGQNEHLLMAAQGCFGIGENIINRRGLRQTGQKGGFGDVQIFSGFVEVRFCASFDTVTGRVDASLTRARAVRR